jgi:hypothetical protein
MNDIDIQALHRRSLMAAKSFYDAYHNSESNADDVLNLLDTYISLRRMLPSDAEGRHFMAHQAYDVTEYGGRYLNSLNS